MSAGPTIANVNLGAVPPATILVVDDNPVNLQVLVRTLDGTGHRILAAKDPQSALTIARRAKPELILLDVMMPVQDGFDVCRVLKADPATRDSMVIFLSALGEVTDKVHGLELGAVDYITKPIQAEEVPARVASHLGRQYLERELRRSRDRLDRELESAARMQYLLLPKALPARSGLSFGAHYQTSRHAGGDYYDVLDLGGGCIGIMVADVSGHGAPAAIVMAMLRAALHAHPGPRDPSALFSDLSSHFSYLRDSGMFATAIYAVIDTGSRRARFACAGHPPPLVYRRDGVVAALAVEGVPPLFLFELGHVPTTEARFGAGDRLLLYTDGVTDREAGDGLSYGLERLSAALGSVGARIPGEIVQAVVADVAGFSAGREADDDQTLLAIGFD